MISENRKNRDGGLRFAFPVRTAVFMIGLVLFLGSIPSRSYAAFASEQVAWERIPELVREGSPAWLELSAGELYAKKLTETACETFKKEMYENVELIDESLETIRQRKLELNEMKPDTVVGPEGKTAAQALAEEKASEKLLKEERRQIVKAVAAVVLPAMHSANQAVEELEPEFETIVDGVRETVIARQQLEAERDALAARSAQLNAQAKAAKAFCGRGMISEAEMTETVIAASETEADLKSVNASLEKLDRSLRNSLGLGGNGSLCFTGIPAAEAGFAEKIDRASDLNKTLENSKKLKDAKDSKSFSVYGSAEAQKTAVKRIEGELTENYEKLYTDVISTAAEYDTAMKTYSETHTAFRVTEKQYEKGKISLLSFMEERAGLAEAESRRKVAELAFFTAQERYRTFMDRIAEKE